MKAKEKDSKQLKQESKELNEEELQHIAGGGVDPPDIDIYKPQVADTDTVYKINVI